MNCIYLTNRRANHKADILGALGIRPVFLAVFLALAAQSAPLSAETLMLEQPSVAGDRIAFVYAGDIWVADRDGSNTRRLTSSPATENAPALSPDGEWVAYSANYNGNTDVYVVNAKGGQPKRLTYHPGGDTVRGWTPDGTGILFRTSREVMAQRGEQLYTVSRDGGFPASLPMPQAFDGSFSSDGARLAYQVIRPAYFGGSGWKRYRGGMSPAIWIFDMTGHEVEKIPHDRVNDTNPMWVGDKVYFLSDRAGKVNIFAYDVTAKTLNQVTNHDVWDIKSAAATTGAIVYEAGGRLYELDLAGTSNGGKGNPLSITLRADLPQLVPQWKDASQAIAGAALSRGGARALFAARGDIFTVPAKKGDIRNLTKSDGTNDRDPLWSPDGQQIAWLTDDSGVFELIIRDQSGSGEGRRIKLGDGIYYFLGGWSPDGETIFYSDPHLNLYVLDIGSGRSTLIDTDTRRSFVTAPETSFSSDGRWLAYTRSLDNYMNALFLYDLKEGVAHQVTGGMAHVGSPAFSLDGKYLYITASTNFGPSTVGLDMSSQERPVRRGIYAIVLAADGATPLPPESDEEEPSDAADGEDEKKAASGGWPGSGRNDKDRDTGIGEKIPVTHIDLDGLADRMVALPLAERDYTGLSVAKGGNLFYLEMRQPGVTNEPPGSERNAVHALKRFDFEKRKEETFLDAVAGFTISSDGSKILVSGPDQSWSIIDTDEKPKVNGKPLNLSEMKAFVDPRREWRHIFNDVWKMEKEYFYAPGMHGLDWAAVRDKYEPLIEHVARREDLTTLLVDMIAEMQVGHNRTGGGDLQKEKPVPVGLLGADYEIVNDRYRIKRIFTGEKWNPFLNAPLAVPGLGVSDGDYILAVNHRALTGADNIHAFLDRAVGKQTIVTVGSGPDMEDGRDITVIPIASDRRLRLWSWVEANRRRVSDATDGRVGYIYLPNTGGSGFSFFNRYYFSQVDKEALIIDERFNGGGQAANYITEVLGRPYLSSWKDRDGLISTTPGGVVPGPKVMLINEYAGSGGDFLPWSFRYTGLGPLIGKRTWGGLIGISVNPRLIDGGVLTVPFFRYFDPDGNWTIENQGVAPDIEVEQTPKAVIAGHDPQLERGIEEILKALTTYEPVRLLTSPPDPTELGK